MPRKPLEPIGAYGTRGSFDFHQEIDFFNVGTDDAPDLQPVYRATISVVAEGKLSEAGNTVIDQPGVVHVALKGSDGNDYKLTPWTVDEIRAALPDAFGEASKSIKNTYGTGSPEYKQMAVSETKNNL